MPTEDEIREQIDATDDSALCGMSYEEGVKVALEWVLGDSTDAPIDI